eukprot:NODE_4326_length_806_cov_28.288660_g4168_i0.p1 GENE.NODE_4326_length_806_cov_28.288660_g4168_i0~~NODE_4326_length_806_cov_28.288660_g4168_i0.p1  ORF type:complete len:252 (-),score=90.77 NODE_4326_length_806_cov_28.288660_g4168_i0:51-764(-)
MPLLEWAVVAVSGCILLGYHLWWQWMVHHRPERTVYGATLIARQEYINKVMSEPKYVIMGVQTLRNAIMACSLLTSSSLVLLAFILGALLDQRKAEDIYGLATIDPLGLSSIPNSLKLYIVCVDVFFGFVSSLQSVRLNMLVGFHIFVTNDEAARVTAGNLLKSAGSFWTIALRWYYLLVPLTMWVFGTSSLLLGSLLLAAWLYYVDIRVNRIRTFEVLDGPGHMEMAPVGEVAPPS